MPPPAILDWASIDCNRLLYTREQIYEVLPQRGQFAQLDGVVHLDLEAGTLAGIRDVREDEWWCAGHMPGKPIFPGVLMVETAAQLAAFATHFVQPDAKSFLGFGGIDNAKFRDSVIPPARIILACKSQEIRRKRIVCATQAYVNGKIVFEGTIIGLRLEW